LEATGSSSAKARVKESSALLETSNPSENPDANQGPCDLGRLPTLPAAGIDDPHFGTGSRIAMEAIRPAGTGSLKWLKKNIFPSEKKFDFGF
jgi:hypothetical protein